MIKSRDAALLATPFVRWCALLSAAVLGCDDGVIRELSQSGTGS